MKTSYEHLVALCALPPDFTASTPQHDPRTARVRYLVQALTEMGAVFDEDCFDASGQNRPADDIPRFVNLMALVPAGNLRSTRSVIFVAHHDVHTPHYQNANDNSASCANLLELLERLMADVPPYHRTYIVFTDAEEIVSYSTPGGPHPRRILW
jgi:acetylornithine deacetylase/succinyl-diaminopimelate desuccinylase-like protein